MTSQQIKVTFSKEARQGHVDSTEKRRRMARTLSNHKKRINRAPMWGDWQLERVFVE